MSSILSLSRTQLAAEGAGIPKYVEELKAQKKGYVAHVQKEYVENRNTTIVLLVLSVLSAVASAVLFNFSGGMANPSLFIPAVVTGVLFALFVIGSGVRNCRHFRESEALKKALEQQEDEEIHAAEVLNEMCGSNISEKQINAVIKTIGDKQTPFIKYAYQSYFGPNHSKLSKQQNMVWRALANCDAIMDVKIKKEERSLAAEVLRSQNQSITRKAQGLRFVKRLFTIIGEPTTKNEYKALAQFPTLLAQRMQKNHGRYRVHFKDVFAEMDLEKRAEFLKEMRRGFIALKEDTENDTTQTQSNICASISMGLDLILEYNSLKKTFKDSPEWKKLILEIACWLPYVAHTLGYLKHLAFMESLSEVIESQFPKEESEKLRGNYIKKLVFWMHGNGGNAIIKHILNEAVELPPLIKDLFESLPGIMIAMQKDVGVNVEGKEHVKNVLKAMKGPDKVIAFLLQAPREEEKFKEYIAQTIENDLDMAVVFFENEANNFQTFLMENESLKNREKHALNILKKLSSKVALDVITFIDDSNDSSHTHFTCFVNLLKDKTKDLSNHQVRDYPLEDAKLIALFRYSCAGSTFSFEGEEWKKFNEIAKQQENVVRSLTENTED